VSLARASQFFCNLYGVLSNQVELEVELPKTLYDFKILLPSEVRFLMFQEALEAQFGLNVRRVADKVIVKKADKAPNPSAPPSRGLHFELYFGSVVTPEMAVHALWTEITRNAN